MGGIELVAQPGNFRGCNLGSVALQYELLLTVLQCGDPLLQLSFGFSGGLARDRKHAPSCNGSQPENNGHSSLPAAEQRSQSSDHGNSCNNDDIATAEATASMGQNGRADRLITLVLENPEDKVVLVIESLSLFGETPTVVGVSQCCLCRRQAKDPEFTAYRREHQVNEFLSEITIMPSHNQTNDREHNAG
jgi:hypothetical protein